MNVHAQFGGLGGMATGKLLQEFHLPSSPADLLQFVLQYALQQKIGNTLPLNLNAGDAYPTVEDAQLPGGPFHGNPLSPTLANLRTALPPGDYVVPVMAYCTQYSVHRPGQGTAYKLAPMNGTEAEAIATLLWRGTLAGKSPQELQATNWALQSGTTYSAMPKPYQALVDELIPEYRNSLRGNMLDIVQSTYAEVTGDPRKALQTYLKEKYNKTLPLMLLPKFNIPAPPLEAVLAKMGPAGQLALDAKKQSTILTTAYTTRERGEQVLFEGQGTTLAPQPAAAGPWTARVPGQVYMRFIIKGGNMQADNLMQIRVLPNSASSSLRTDSHLLFASYTTTGARTTDTAPMPTALSSLLGVKVATADTKAASQTLVASGVIGYAVGGAGAQALVPVVQPTTADARLLFADQDITDSNQQVTIGQSITLSVKLDAAARPAAQNPWRISGHAVGGYTQSKQTAAILPVNQTTQTTHFYWVEPGTQLQVTYSYLDASNHQATAQATFTVVAPQVSAEAELSDVQLTHNPGRGDQSPGEWLMLGNIPPAVPIVDSVLVKRGIRITRSVVEGVGAGTFTWLQFVTSDTASQGTHLQRRSCYLDYFNFTDTVFKDSPGDVLTTPTKQLHGYTVKRDFKARTYLLWKPGSADAIPVSLGSLDWGYYGAALYTGTSSDHGWELDPSSRAFSEPFMQHYLLPEWSPTRCPQ